MHQTKTKKRGKQSIRPAVLIFIYFFVISIISITILSLSTVCTYAKIDEIYSYKNLELDMSLSNEMEIIHKEASYSVNEVTAQLFWIPSQDYRQEIIELKTEPDAEIHDDSLLFRWKNPKERKLEFSIETKISTKNEYLPVSKKTRFPVQSLDPELGAYLEPQEKTDINAEIKNLASKLTEEEDDLFFAVFKIASWVHENIKYDSSPEVSDATQKATWVIKNRYGVCDEITNLFISLCRAVGIPSRFVSGSAYSNVEEVNDWGPHGWAEVYFPERGWVPFDVTYGQYGYVDASHIKLSADPDPKQSSVSYTYTGNKIDLEPSQLLVSTKVRSFGEKKSSAIDAKIEALHAGVKIGSYNLVTAKLKNLKEHYITANVKLSETTGVEIISKKEIETAIAPKKEKTIYWIVKVSSDLDKNYIYTLPIITYWDGGSTGTSFISGIYEPAVSEQDARKAGMSYEEQESKPLSEYINAECTAEPERVYQDENAKITCIARNNAGVEFRELNICLDDECTTARLEAKKLAMHSYEKTFDTLGVKNLVFKITSNEISKTAYAQVFVIDRPSLEIKTEHPNTMSYSETGEIEISVARKSESPPKNTRVMLNHKKFNEEWKIGELGREQKIKLFMPGRALSWGKNEISIKAVFEDERGNEYYEEKVIAISLDKATASQRVLLLLADLGNAIEKIIGGTGSEKFVSSLAGKAMSNKVSTRIAI